MQIHLDVRSGSLICCTTCSLETSWASKCAVNLIGHLVPTLWRSLDVIIHTSTHHLLFFREIKHGVEHEWAKLVDKASVQGLNLLTTGDM
jgi:hypothetical protein